VIYLGAIFFFTLTIDAIGSRKLVNDVLHFFCTLSTRRNTVHFSYVLLNDIGRGWGLKQSGPCLCRGGKNVQKRFG